MFSIKSLTGRINLKSFVLEVTPSCNQKCIYCYNVWKHHRYPKGELSLDKWRKIILKLKKETKVRLISISGGEPLLYSEIIELVRFIRSRGIAVNFLTNVALMDEKTAKTLVGLGVSLFEIPLIAPDKKSHKSLKGVDDFEKVVEGIANIRQAGGKIIAVFVATSKNLGLLKETLELGIALGSSGLMFNRINPACKKHIRLMPAAAQLKAALDFLNDFSKRHSYPVFCSIPIPPCVIDMKSYPNISHGYCPSGNSKSYYTIDFLGNVRICNHTPVILGNLLEKGFREIIKNDYVRMFKSVIPESCASCRHSERCRGGCKAAAEACFGRLEASDPFVAANTHL